jgi:DNA-binding transcriptional MerR regulator
MESAKCWSIAELARMSGVTSRTLRHYDDIGLLSPAYIGSNGYRYYEEEHLLRLQQILILRALRVSLTEIGQVIDAETDQIAALRRHHARLLAERDKLGQLADTVAWTIAELESTQGCDAMTEPRINRPENLFEGFDNSHYEAEVRSRWPAEFERAKQAADSLTPEQLESQQRERTAILIKMADFMAAGTAADDPAVLDTVEEHYRGVSEFWTPNAEEYTELAQMYAENEPFRSNLEHIAKGLAAYQSNAMTAYARARLS